MEMTIKKICNDQFHISTITEVILIDFVAQDWTNTSEMGKINK